MDLQVSNLKCSHVQRKFAYQKSSHSQYNDYLLYHCSLHIKATVFPVTKLHAGHETSDIQISINIPIAFTTFYATVQILKIQRFLTME